MAFVRSPHAHARVIAVRAARAGRPRRSPAARCPRASRAPPGLTVEHAPHPLLADGEVRYVGQPVAAVVAASRAQAEDAAERVEVEYEPLEAVMDPRAGDTLVRWEKREGDVAGAFAAAAHVVRDRARDPAPGRGADGAARRARGAGRRPARPSGRRRRARTARARSWRRCWAAPRRRFASSCRMSAAASAPRARSRSRRRWSRSPRSSSAARSWTEDRHENFLSAPQGRGLRAAVELAFDADGRILALRGRMLADLGAYLLPSTPIPPHTTAMLLAGCYDIQDVEVIVTGARTNKVPTGALPRRRPPRGELPDRDDDRRRRPRAAHRPGRAPPPQPGARVPVPDRARLDVRLRRLRALPGPRASS